MAEFVKTIHVLRGLSKKEWRDYFAGQALAAYGCEWTTEETGGIEPRIAMVCYRLADAMLAEREKRENPPNDQR